MNKNNLIKTLKNPFSIVVQLGERGYLKWMSDKIYISIVYWADSYRRLNLTNPVRYSEKIQWVKLYDRKAIYKQYVDKYKVRALIKEKIGDKYLVPMIASYDSIDEIEWDLLPETFVIKCNHGSGANIICDNKSNLDIQLAEKKLRKWMKRDWYWYGREWAYKDMKPKIIVEKYIAGERFAADDFKLICFNGKVHEIEVHMNRYLKHAIQDYDRNWNPIGKGFDGYDTIPNPYRRPICLEEMIELSEVLAEETYISRIDWYIYKEQLYFGEITLYESAGFFGRGSKTEPWDLEIGKYIELPIGE